MIKIRKSQLKRIIGEEIKNTLLEGRAERRALGFEGCAPQSVHDDAVELYDELDGVSLNDKLVDRIISKNRSCLDKLYWAFWKVLDAQDPPRTGDGALIDWLAADYELDPWRMSEFDKAIPRTIRRRR